MSFQEDTEEAINTTEKEEDWIEYIKRSTKEAEEYMKKKKLPCWIVIHKRLKWRMAKRIVSLPEERWTRTNFDWHPGLDNKIKTRRLVGRPKKDGRTTNEFIKPGEVKERTKYDLMNNNSWMTEAKKIRRMEEKKKSV